jgi:hypothetical protein
MQTHQIITIPALQPNMSTDINVEQKAINVEPKVTKVEPKVTKVEPKVDQVGIVVTTYGKNNVFAIQNIKCFRRYLPKAKIFLYLNEVIYKIDIIETCKQLNVETIIVPNQQAYGGLTGTWNDGIIKCMSHKCNVIILSNDDLFVNETIQHIIQEACQSQSKNTMEYFGPVTNHPGPGNEKQLFHLKNINNMSRIVNSRALNGFFMVFPVHVLHKVKFDETHYFDPAFPFGGNEDEWYTRFSKKGGKPIVIPSTFVYHYKLQLWRENIPVKKNVCMYTVNTGDYDDRIIPINTSYDFLYFTDNLNFVYQCVELNIIPFFVEKSDNPKLQQRTIKICPHLYLPPHYDIAVYLDAVIIPNMNVVDTMVNLVSNNQINLIHVKHQERNKIKDEAEKVIKTKLEHADNVNTILSLQQKDKFKDDVGLTETALLVRKYKNMIAFSEEWIKCVKICIRDQISFNYVLWKHNVPSLRVDNVNKKIYGRVSHPDDTMKNKRVKK